ncbi:MAG: hypothetical protein P0116_14495 [Candidatus Nitrosocosmicus sp.]|nr:hypothetical protein [Candidatus Nitrosocosmicus sp.]
MSYLQIRPNALFPSTTDNYNCSAFIEELNIKWTIESVKQTTYPNKQIIIVDEDLTIIPVLKHKSIAKLSQNDFWY